MDEKIKLDWDNILTEQNLLEMLNILGGDGCILYTGDWNVAMRFRDLCFEKRHSIVSLLKKSLAKREWIIINDIGMIYSEGNGSCYVSKRLF